jgi:FtsH-binding integral membrane protein
MEANEQRTRGLLQMIAGVGIIVFAVVLVGLTTPSDSPDWVSIITAAVGLVVAVTGMITILHNRVTK